jgi:hypothetical protein
MVYPKLKRKKVKMSRFKNENNNTKRGYNKDILILNTSQSITANVFKLIVKIYKINLGTNQESERF